MKYVGLVAVWLCLAGVYGCAGDKGQELYETAQFEEKQHNREHAVQLYGEIVAKYPNSPVAARAKERLAELTKTK
jgi:outer membrane protein assembly factor BamD (BamD/ComL family)